jgi:NTE family protein
VPLSPARRLGAEGLIVVNPRHIAPATPRDALSNEEHYPGPLFLLGKAINALLLDRIDNDIDRLHRINAILEAGLHRYGPGFVDAINSELSANDRISNIRPLEVVHIRASRDIGKAAGDYVRSRTFEASAPRAVVRLLRRVADWEGPTEADLTSYLLFDGPYARILVDMATSDARARHDALCTFFENRIRGAEQP